MSTSLPDAQVIVIGSGAAGLMAAIAAGARARRNGDVLLITDGPVGRSNTAMAQGGLQLPGPGDGPRDAFIHDSLASARVPVDRPRVERFVDHVRPVVERLMDWGLELERGPDGAPRRRIAGGLSTPRIVGGGSRIGPQLIRVLRRRLSEGAVVVRDRSRVVDLQPGADRVGITLQDGRRLSGRRVVCCAGGTTWREARRRGQQGTNPANGNHHLTDLLLARGLPQVEPVAFQHHPFGLVGTARDGVGVCVPESINGTAVRLLDRHGRSIGTPRQDRLDLARRMFAVAEQGDAWPGPDGQPGIRLTLSELPDGLLERDFPKVWRRLVRAGETHGGRARDVLVFPFLHYQLGGFRVDLRGNSPLPGLLLAGEMVGGIHGLNRLMGNGLTDSLVHGWLTGAEAVDG